MTTIRTPRAGDLAWHKNGLDPRRVLVVTSGGVYLDIGGTEYGPYPRSNYRFTAPAERATVAISEAEGATS